MKTKKEKLYLILIAVFAAATLAVILFCSRRPEPVQETYVPVEGEPDHKVVIREVEKLVEVEKTITGEMMQDGLRDMGTLITEEYYFTEVVSFTSVKKFFKTELELPFTESGYLASYDGVVTAGLDFTAIRVEKEEDRITVHLPKTAVQTVSIDPDSFELYSEKIGFANPISAEDYNTSLAELEQTAVDKALERGLLERADANARQVITNFIGGLTDLSAVQLTFTNS